jgi:hypothetical protein
MKTPRFIRCLTAGLAILAAIANPARAQTPAPSPSPAAPINLHGPGANILVQDAPLSEVVDLLRRDFPKWDFVLSPSAESIPIAHLHVRALNLDDALYAIEFASNNAITWRTEDNRLIFIDSARDETPQVDAFSLNGYVDPHDDKNIVNDRLTDLQLMIARTVDEFENADPGGPQNRISSSFNYYPSANIVVIVGSGEELEVARKIMRAVTNPSNASPPIQMIQGGKANAIQAQPGGKGATPASQSP